MPMINGLGSTLRESAVAMAMGSSNTAVALLLKIWLNALVRKMMAKRIIWGPLPSNRFKNAWA